MPLARRGTRAGALPAKFRRGGSGRGGGEGVVSEHQELKAHLLGAWGREGVGRRWGSHGGRGGGGGVLVGEKVPVRKWGNAPVQKLQQEERKLLVRLNRTEKERREGFDGDRSSPARR
jgi:hypothetical protein